ncbi:hypothetical protein HDV06_001698 [Boothiomyces sp. JEL0866]|nr:hypothetical protein HDV06_001698 [Boothiomyces sp. JEL0866]
MFKAGVWKKIRHMYELGGNITEICSDIENIESSYRSKYTEISINGTFIRYEVDSNGNKLRIINYNENLSIMNKTQEFTTVGWGQSCGPGNNGQCTCKADGCHMSTSYEFYNNLLYTSKQELIRPSNQCFEKWGGGNRVPIQGGIRTKWWGVYMQDIKNGMFQQEIYGMIAGVNENIYFILDTQYWGDRIQNEDSSFQQVMTEDWSWWAADDQKGWQCTAWSYFRISCGGGGVLHRYTTYMERSYDGNADPNCHPQLQYVHP